MEDKTYAKKVMLAVSESPSDADLERHLKDAGYLLGSFKLDGCRAVVINSKLISRKALPYENPFVQQWAKENEVALMGLDGELIIGEPCEQFEGDNVFNRSSGPLGKQTGTPDFTFYVFEAHDAGSMLAEERYQYVKNSVEYAKPPRVKVVEQVRLHTLAEIKQYAAKAALLGYEGIMLKRPDKKYKNGRSTLLEGILMKVKDWTDSEAVIIGVKQGTTNTNELKKDELGHAKRSSAKAGKVPIETIGSWLVRDLYSGIEFSCPPGPFTEEQLKQLWKEHNSPDGSHVGKILTYKYQRVGTLRKPRFPGAFRFRPKFDIDVSKVHADLRHYVE